MTGVNQGLVDLIDEFRRDQQRYFQELRGRIDKIEERLANHSRLVEDVECLRGDVDAFGKEEVFFGSRGGQWEIRLRFKKLPKMVWNLGLVAFVVLLAGVYRLFGGTVTPADLWALVMRQ